MIELALALVGFVMVYMAGPTWLRPPFRPFTCGFCLSWWISVLMVCYAPGWGVVIQAGLNMFVAGVAGVLFPELLFDRRGHPKVVDDVGKPG